MIAVEGISGFDVGEVSLTGEIVRLQMKKRSERRQPRNEKSMAWLQTGTLIYGPK